MPIDYIQMSIDVKIISFQQLIREEKYSMGSIKWELSF